MQVALSVSLFARHRTTSQPMFASGQTGGTGLTGNTGRTGVSSVNAPDVA